jgi:hypothetical protein
MSREVEDDLNITLKDVDIFNIKKRSAIFRVGFDRFFIRCHFFRGPFRDLSPYEKRRFLKAPAGIAGAHLEGVD